MVLYLVVHTPRETDGEETRAPTRLADMARDAGAEGGSPRWLKTWSPDVLDERIFSLWEADDDAEIAAALAHYGFLDDMAAEPLRVREWGPAEVLAAEG